MAEHLATKHISLSFKPPSKLTLTNYSLWKSQIVPLLRSYNLFKFVDGSFQCPAKYFRKTSAAGIKLLAESKLPADEDDDQNEFVMNPDYSFWINQDQAILAWLFQACSEDTHSQVLECTFSHEVWIRLEHNYNATTKSRLMQLKSDLVTLKKSNDSMVVYFNKARSLSYQLTQIDRAITDEDLVFHILQGLPFEYNAFKTSIATQQLKDVNLVTSSEFSFGAKTKTRMVILEQRGISFSVGDLVIGCESQAH